MRRGDIAIIVAISLLTLAAFGALAVDLGVARIAHSELKGALDASAQAGASQLDGTATGMPLALEVAAQYANLNAILKDSPSFSSSGTHPTGSITLGTWSDGAFAPATDPQKVNAVESRLRLATVPTFLGRVAFQTDFLTVSDVSVSVTGGLGGAACPIPIAIPSCAIPASAEKCDMDITFGPDGGDNGAWATIGTSRPSASSIRSALTSCTAASNVDDVVTMNNGEVASAAKELAKVVDASSKTWDASWGAQPAQSARSGVKSYGHVLEGYVIVFDDPAACSGTKYNGSSMDITGYLSVAVYDVDTTGKAAERAVRMHSYCQMVTGEGGGGWYGTTVTPSLVQ